MAATRPEIAVYYCGLWHRYDHMDAWHGYGWNEWELLRNAKPRYPGHRQPIVPAWGYFDESDPTFGARQIDLAADHGIDVMIYDWYWYSGVKLMEAPLERAFLGAPNRKRLKFALMWANHEWADYFPAPAPGTPWNSWLPIRHSAADTLRMIDYCIEHYFREPNYWRVDGGKLYFSLFKPVEFVQALGGAASTQKVFGDVNQLLSRHDLPPIHWNGIFQQEDDLNAGVSLLRSAGFGSITTYNLVRSSKISNQFTSAYDDVIDEHDLFHQRALKTSLPYAPVISVGWDVSPRCRYDVSWPFPPSPLTGKFDYPYMPVIVGNTPEKVERLCRLARKQAEADKGPLNAVFVNAWNEWTEGSYLLPDTEYGNAYLEALRRALG